MVDCGLAASLAGLGAEALESAAGPSWAGEPAQAVAHFFRLPAVVGPQIVTVGLTDDAPTLKLDDSTIEKYRSTA